MQDSHLAQAQGEERDTVFSVSGLLSGYRDNITMKVITREALGIYIFAKPANQQERDFNARMMKKRDIA